MIPRYNLSRYSRRGRVALSHHEFYTLAGAVEAARMCTRLGEVAKLRALDPEHERLIHTPEGRRKVQWVSA